LFNGKAQLPGGKPGLFCGSPSPRRAHASADHKPGEHNSGIDPHGYHSHGDPAQDSHDDGQKPSPGAGDCDYDYVEARAPRTTTTTTTTTTMTTTRRPTGPGGTASGPRGPPKSNNPPAASQLLTKQSTCPSTVGGFALTGPTLTSVTLCPATLDSPESAATLESITVRNGKPLESCRARSQTLLHEGVHIMLRGHMSPDSACTKVSFCSFVSLTIDSILSVFSSAFFAPFFSFYSSHCIFYICKTLHSL
jgi:hypothetical protein